MKKLEESHQCRRHGLLVAVVLGLFLSFVSQAVSAQSARRTSGRVVPSDPQVSTPEEQGMDSGALAEGIDFLMSNRETYRIHSVVVIRNDHVVLDAGFYPFLPEWGHDIASVTKSVTSTLVGIAIDKGYLDDVDARVLDFFPDYTVANLDPRKRRMTLEHLLTMRSGFECDPTNSEATLTEMTASADWVQFTLDLPMEDEPGERRVYCSPNVHLLSAILQRATGMGTLEFARLHLFGPLGIRDVMWLTDPQGIHRGWGDLHLRPIDMTKIGFLFLNEGRWRGRQIVSSWWAEEATTGAGQQIPGWPVGEGYSYLWYYAPDYYYASGRGGQLIYVFPEKDLVVGFNAGDGIGDHFDIHREFLETWVLGAIESADPLPANPGAVALLDSKITEAAESIEGPPDEVGELPALAHAISGLTYVLDPNGYGLSELRLTFPGSDEATLEVGMPEVIGGPMIEYRIGLDNINRFTPGRHGVMTAAKGRWVSDDLFSAVIDEIGLINLWQWDVLFDGDTVALELISLAGGELPATITGRLAP